ncbi:MAG: hypothetical protein IT222_10500 [Crocinitomix sp.]|nr:hypothetical protein [Crocinitomix sp.]
MKTWCLILFLIAINHSFCQEDDVVQETTANEVEEPKGRPYFNVNINPYILNTSFDLIGLEARIDHFYHNSVRLDFGYGIAGRVGVPYDSDVLFAFSAYLIGLHGKKANKFEISFGLNIPYTNMQNGYQEPYEFVHFGIGYRYVADDSPFTIRIGIASTGFLNAGLGFKFPNKKK